MTEQAIKYRPDIDGLRAISVLAVLAFHLQAPFTTGGFVGVDVFFVISGYLITGILYRELQRGQLSLLEFFERRVRRIFPALFAMLAVTWCAATLILLPPDLESFSKSLLAATLSFANVYFYSEAGYFNEASDLTPLLHTWSLGVEEQFYLLWPFVLLALARWLKRWLLPSVGALWLLSFAANLFTVENAPDAAFYLLPFRAWELLTGALLVFAPQADRFGRAGQWIGLVGLLFIANSVVNYSSSTMFPGWAALAPALGAAMIIYAGGATTGGVITRVLGTPLLVGLGRISYSLYLWHWPLWSLAVYYSSAPLSGLERGLVAMAAVALAVISWRFIERPFRHSATIEARRVWIGAGALATLACLVGLLGISSKGWPSRHSREVQSYAKLLKKERFFKSYDRGGCFLDYEDRARDYDLEKCITFSEKQQGKKRRRVLLFGDSYAANLYPGLKSLSSVDVRQFTATSCRPLDSGNRRCRQFFHHFFSKVLKRSKDDVVVVSGHWRPRYEDLGSRRFEKQVENTLRRLKRSRKNIVLVGQSPTFHKPVPLTLAIQSKIEGEKSEPLRLEPKDATRVNRTLRKIAKRLKVRFFDPYGAACHDNQCIVANGRNPFHWDQGHMTPEGSKYYARRLEGALSFRSTAR